MMRRIIKPRSRSVFIVCSKRDFWKKYNTLWEVNLWGRTAFQSKVLSLHNSCPMTHQFFCKRGIFSNLASQFLQFSMIFQDLFLRTEALKEKDIDPQKNHTNPSNILFVTAGFLTRVDLWGASHEIHWILPPFSPSEHHSRWWKPAIIYTPNRSSKSFIICRGRGEVCGIITFQFQPFLVIVRRWVDVSHSTHSITYAPPNPHIEDV